MKIKEIFPWWLKILLKLIFARMPFGYNFWRRIGLFRHGRMDNLEYAEKTFHEYFSVAGINPNEMKGKTLLELGPGDTIIMALIASSYGIKTVLLDVDNFAVNDVSLYKSLAQDLLIKGYAVPALDDVRSLDDILNICEARYLTNGLNDLSQVKDNTVDMIVSQAVLEHILKSEFSEMMYHCRRILTFDGTCVHEVDLKDHLSRSLNNLRFKETIWESTLFTTSGFYTNRLQLVKILDVLRIAGFSSTVVRSKTWGDTLPISKKYLAAPFKSMSEDELNISEFVVLLKPV